MMIGIDVSKDKLDIRILPMNQHFIVKNTPSGISNVMKNGAA